METTNLTMKELLEAGAHFGHRVSNRDPRMDRYIFAKRKGVHIINLHKTVILYEEAQNYVKNVAANGGKMLLVGTKKQAKDIVKQAAEKIDEFYITTRWIGGLLTNYRTVRKSIEKLKKLKILLADEEEKKKYLKKDIQKMKKKLEKLSETFDGVIDMKKPPEIIFVIDAFHEKNCIHEAKLVGVPICGLVDTNSNPDDIDILIPANDDAIRSISLFVNGIADAFMEGKQLHNSMQLESAQLQSEGYDLKMPESKRPDKDASTKNKKKAKNSLKKTPPKRNLSKQNPPKRTHPK